MEIKEIAKWDLFTTNELFFDETLLLIVSKGTNICVKRLGHEDWTTLSLDKESQKLCAQRFSQFRISVRDSFICGLSESEKILLFRYSPFKKFKLDIKYEKVLGFSFIANKDSECNLFIVTNSNLMLYKLKNKLRLIKNIQSIIIEYAFEEKEGILALISNCGRVSVYFLYEPKGSKNYSGCSFDLCIDRGVSRPVTSGPKGNNLLNFMIRLDCNQIQFYKIYDSPYLIHLDNLNGKVYLYKIYKEKQPDVFKYYSISQGIYGLGLSENLLLIQSYNTQETFIYDIQNPSPDFLIKVSHSEYVYEAKSNRKSAEFSMKIELTSEYYFVTESIVVDLRANAIKSLQVHPSALIENHPDNLKIILFLLRRENCKIRVLDKLRESLLSLTPIKRLESIFNTLALAYATAREEKANNSTITRIENMSEFDVSEADPLTEVKNEDGVTVLLQADIYYYIFDPAYKNIKNRKYLADALLSFSHFFIKYGMSIHPSIQYLFFKLLIKIEDYRTVQNLVEHKFFTDSQQIALFLVSLGKSSKASMFPFCFVLGIDMLMRLKLFDEVSNELADQTYTYEALDFGISKKINSSTLSQITKKCSFDSVYN